MKVLLLIASIFISMSAAAQTNVIVVPVGDYTQASYGTNSIAILTLLNPNPRTVGNIVIRQDPIRCQTDTNSTAYFTNVIWGKYRLEAGPLSGYGTAMTPFVFYVGTNTLGTVQVASLITNSAAVPPNPGTNYYTMAQMDALLAGLTNSGSSGTSTGAVQQIVRDMGTVTNNGTQTITTTGNIASQSGTVSGAVGSFGTVNATTGNLGTANVTGTMTANAIGGNALDQTTNIINAQLAATGVVTNGGIGQNVSLENTNASYHSLFRPNGDGFQLIPKGNSGVTNGMSLLVGDAAGDANGLHWAVDWSPSLFSHTLVGNLNSGVSLHIEMHPDDSIFTYGDFNFQDTQHGSFAGTFTGNGSSLSNLPAANLTGGPIPKAVITGTAGTNAVLVTDANGQQMWATNLPDANLSNKVISSNLVTLTYSSGTNVLVDFTLGRWFMLSVTNTYYLIPTNISYLDVDGGSIQTTNTTGGLFGYAPTNLWQFPSGQRLTTTTNAGAKDLWTFKPSPAKASLWSVQTLNFQPAVAP